jgi:hypothetical protein
MAKIPDYLPVTGRGTIDVAGYISKCDLGYCPGLPRSEGPNTVYAPDLRTVVGHEYPGKGFVPLDTNPADVPYFPVHCYSNGKEVPCSTTPLRSSP